MALWYYYDENGIKRGPVNGSQLRVLASAMTINQSTILETESGQQGLAGQVEGLFSPRAGMASSRPAVAPSEIAYCAHCGTQIAKLAVVCPRCGCRVNSRDYRNADTSVRINTYLTESILVTIFCCFPLGVAAIIFSCLASSAAKNGDEEEAASKAKVAGILCLVSFLVTLLVAFIWFVLFVIAGSASL